MSVLPARMEASSSVIILQTVSILLHHTVAHVHQDKKNKTTDHAKISILAVSQEPLIVTRMRTVLTKVTLTNAYVTTVSMATESYVTISMNVYTEPTIADLFNFATTQLDPIHALAARAMNEPRREHAEISMNVVVVPEKKNAISLQLVTIEEASPDPSANAMKVSSAMDTYASLLIHVTRQRVRLEHTVWLMTQWKLNADVMMALKEMDRHASLQACVKHRINVMQMPNVLICYPATSASVTTDSSETELHVKDSIHVRAKTLDRVIPTLHATGMGLDTAVTVERDSLAIVKM